MRHTRAPHLANVGVTLSLIAILSLSAFLPEIAAGNRYPQISATSPASDGTRLAPPTLNDPNTPPTIPHPLPQTSASSLGLRSEPSLLSPIAMGASSETYGSPQSAAWENLTRTVNATPPAGMYAQSIAFDPSDDYYLLFGGVTGAAYGDALNQTWIFQGTGWRELHPALTPPAREYASMAWDPVDQYLVLFGGLGACDLMVCGDTWTFVGGNWTPVITTPSPSAREFAAFSTDGPSGPMLLYGGLDASGRALNDTWTFAHGNWTQVTPRMSPPARAGAAMSYDPSEGSVVLFGGANSSYLGDTWTYSNATWSQAQPASSPGARWTASLTFLPSLNRLVLFGGKGSNPTRLADTWWFSKGDWSNATSGGLPPDVSAVSTGSSGPSVVLLGTPSYPDGAVSSTMPMQTWEYYTINVTASATATAGDGPMNTTFNATATGGQPPYRYAWGLPDGTNASGPEVAIVITSPGPWVAYLQVEDALNVTTRALLTGVVYPAILLTAVAVPLSGPAPLNVTLVATTSGGDPPISYLWSSPPSGIQAGPNATFTFGTPGAYQVKLAVADQFGVEATRTFDVNVSPTVRPAAPLGLSLTANRTEGDAPFAVQFASLLSGGVAPYEYSWGFGDGTSSSGTDPAHAYQAAGDFTVELTAVDSRGTSTTANLTVLVQPALTILANATVLSGGSTPFTVDFTSNVAGGWGPYVVLWQFGDGFSGSGANPSHAYPGGGNYTATAEVIDGMGYRVTSTALHLVIERQSGPGTGSAQSVLNGPWGLTVIGVGAFGAGALAAGLVVWIRRVRNHPRG